MQPAPEVDEAGDDQPLLKHAVLVRGQPPEIRRGFGWKVYGIVFILAILCWATTAPFALRIHGAEKFLERTPNFLLICWIALILQMVLHLSVSGVFGTCLRTPRILKNYVWLLQTSPWNCIYLFLQALIMGCILGGISLSCTRWSMLYIFLAVCGMLVFFTVYSILTGYDFSNVGEKVKGFSLGLMIILIVFRLVTHSYFLFRIWAGAWASLLAAVIVMTTQLIFGTARTNPQMLEYTIDMYAYVAFELYQHFFFLYIACTYCIGDREPS